MKKIYEKPDAELIKFLIEESLMDAGLGYSENVGEDDEEGI